MIEQKKFYECLQKEGVEFITGVPDTLLNEFCLYVEEHCPPGRHVIAANEGNAIALAAGYHMATGTVPLVYMQNSGMGNALNPLLSLAGNNLYGMPMILLIGWRGDPSTKDHPQHNLQGELTPVLLDNMDIPYEVVSSDEGDGIDVARWAARTARETGGPVGLIAKKGMFECGEKEDLSKQPSAYEMSREDAMKCVIESLPSDAIYVATTGRASRELHALRKLSGGEHGSDFLNVGAMGHASSIATGIALAHPSRQVVCLDGDCAAIMHLGAMTTVAKYDLPNLLHIVLNNGVHESVGGQPSAGKMIDFTSIAEASGYATLGAPVTTREELQHSVQNLSSKSQASFIDIHIRKGMRSNLEPLRFNHKDAKNGLIRELDDGTR
jgi:phosphonopyruvate decarboxylase